MLISHFNRRKYTKKDWKFWNRGKKSEPKNNTLRNIALGTAGTAALLYGGRVGMKALPKIQRLKNHTHQYGVINKLYREGGYTPEMRADYNESIRSLIIRNKDSLKDLDYMTKNSMGMVPKKLEQQMIMRKIGEQVEEDIRRVLKKPKKPQNNVDFVTALLKKYKDPFERGFDPKLNPPKPPKP